MEGDELETKRRRSNEIVQFSRKLIW